MASHELRILQRIKQHRYDHDIDNGNCLVRLLDHFVTEGPNGSHQCLVTELLGPSIANALESFRGNRLPITGVKSITR